MFVLAGTMQKKPHAKAAKAAKAAKNRVNQQVLVCGDHALIGEGTPEIRIQIPLRPSRPLREAQ